jgi:hypothetical protein
MSRRYSLEPLSSIRPAARPLPAVNMAIKRRDVELGQQAAQAAFGSPVRVAPLGSHPRLRGTAAP